MTELSCNFGAGIRSPTLGRSVDEFNAPYGIPYDYITPDVFGERNGAGSIPPGTRGYTWTNWQGWLANDASSQSEDEFAKEYQIAEMKAGLMTILIIGSAIGGILAYDSWRKKREPKRPDVSRMTYMEE